MIMAKSSISSGGGGGIIDDGTLLVNFSSHCRLSSSLSDSSSKEEEANAKLKLSNNNNNGKLSVRFAEKGLITFIDLPDHDERRERWFFEDDIDTFKRRMLQERHRISSKLTTTTTPICSNEKDSDSMHMYAHHIVKHNQSGTFACSLPCLVPIEACIVFV